MLNNFVEKEKTFEYKIKSNLKKINFFQKGSPMLLVKKVQFFSLFVFAQNKIRSEV